MEHLDPGDSCYSFHKGAGIFQTSLCMVNLRVGVQFDVVTDRNGTLQDTAVIVIIIDTS